MIPKRTRRTQHVRRENLMDHFVATAATPLSGPRHVPTSKSHEQRALVLAALADRPVRLERALGARPPGDDTRRTAAAVAQIGRWQPAGALGRSKTSETLDLGAGATGFRFTSALACLRPAGARTLVRGRPALLHRPHGILRRALTTLGGRVKRRSSGALRVHGGGLEGGRLVLDPSVSSQYASALLLVAPRMTAGLDLRLAGRPASLPYLRITLDLLASFGADVAVEGLTSDRPRLVVTPSALGSEAVVLPPDASAAAAWWAAAALVGGEAWVPGLRASSPQSDVALLDILLRMGVQVDETSDGSARVSSDGGRLQAAGDVDVRDPTDLVFLVGVLAAAADGVTRIHGAAPTRGKESDRIAVLCRGLRRMGADVEIEADEVIRIEGRALHGARIDLAADHRAAFAFGILGLKVPGVVLGGAGCVEKSQPRFLEDLAGCGRGRP